MMYKAFFVHMYNYMDDGSIHQTQKKHNVSKSDSNLMSLFLAESFSLSLLQSKIGNLFRNLFIQEFWSQTSEP